MEIIIHIISSSESDYIIADLNRKNVFNKILKNFGLFRVSL